MNELDPNNFVDVAKEAVFKPEAIPKAQEDAVDISKAYDVFCKEGTQQVVYRRARFRVARRLLHKGLYDPFSEFVELEQADGTTIFVSRSSVIKFSESDTTTS